MKSNLRYEFTRLFEQARELKGRIQKKSEELYDILEFFQNIDAVESLHWLCEIIQEELDRKPLLTFLEKEYEVQQVGIKNASEELRQEFKKARLNLNWEDRKVLKFINRRLDEHNKILIDGIKEEAA